MSKLRTVLINEPVAFFGGLQGILLAVFVLARVFHWWVWSTDQQTAVMALWAAVTAFLTWVIRQAVTPNSRVASEWSPRP